MADTGIIFGNRPDEKQKTKKKQFPAACDVLSSSERCLLPTRPLMRNLIYSVWNVIPIAHRSRDAPALRQYLRFITVHLRFLAVHLRFLFFSATLVANGPDCASEFTGV